MYKTIIIGLFLFEHLFQIYQFKLCRHEDHKSFFIAFKLYNKFYRQKKPVFEENELEVRVHLLCFDSVRLS